ncbi:MAG: hypothetical protein ACO3EQ_03380 [Ilumatobacteraceae bacterium]
MTTALDHPHAALLQQHREQILALFSSLNVVIVGVLCESSPIRLHEIHDIEFVAKVPLQRSLGNILKTEVELDNLLGLDTYIHDLSCECEESRMARKDVIPL